MDAVRPPWVVLEAEVLDPRVGELAEGAPELRGEAELEAVDAVRP